MQFAVGTSRRDERWRFEESGDLIRGANSNLIWVTVCTVMVVRGIGYGCVPFDVD